MPSSDSVGVLHAEHGCLLTTPSSPLPPHSVHFSVTSTTPFPLHSGQGIPFAITDAISFSDILLKSMLFALPAPLHAAQLFSPVTSLPVPPHFVHETIFVFTNIPLINC